MLFAIRSAMRIANRFIMLAVLDMRFATWIESLFNMCFVIIIIAMRAYIPDNLVEKILKKLEGSDDADLREFYILLKRSYTFSLANKIMRKKAEEGGEDEW